jgi:hypothetical protein
MYEKNLGIFFLGDTLQGNKPKKLFLKFLKYSSYSIKDGFRTMPLNFSDHDII